MGSKLLTITIFGCGLAVYMAARQAYIPSSLALPLLIFWVIVLRKVRPGGARRSSVTAARAQQATAGAACGARLRSGQQAQHLALDCSLLCRWLWGR